jgi:hypothetical protein
MASHNNKDTIIISELQKYFSLKKYLASKPEYIIFEAISMYANLLIAIK